MKLFNDLFDRNRKQRPLGMCFFADEGDDQTGGGAGTSDPTPTVSWKDAISDDLRNHPSLTDITDVSSLAKSFIHTQSMIGMDKIPLPKDEKDAAWGDVFKKLGRPDTPEGYDIKKPEDFPQNMTFDEQFAKKMAEKAFEAGLSKNQLAKLMSEYNGYYASRVQEMEQARALAVQETKNKLQTDWGSAYQQNLNLALRAVKAYADDEMVQYLESTGAGDDPRFIKLFHKIGERMVEDTAEGQGSGLIQTPELAKSEITALKSDKEFMAAYLDRNHINHKNTVVKMSQLFKLAYPDATPGA